MQVNAAVMEVVAATRTQTRAAEPAAGTKIAVAVASAAEPTNQAATATRTIIAAELAVVTNMMIAAVSAVDVNDRTHYQ